MGEFFSLLFVDFLLTHSQTHRRQSYLFIEVPLANKLSLSFSRRIVETSTDLFSSPVTKKQIEKEKPLRRFFILCFVSWDELKQFLFIFTIFFEWFCLSFPSPSLPTEFVHDTQNHFQNSPQTLECKILCVRSVICHGREKLFKLNLVFIVKFSSVFLFQTFVFVFHSPTAERVWIILYFRFEAAYKFGAWVTHSTVATHISSSLKRLHQSFSFPCKEYDILLYVPFSCGI